MESTIKSCFEIYQNNLKSIHNTTYTPETMTIEEIENTIDLIHMKYIMASTYSISKSCIQCVAYNHLKSLIEQYYERNEYYTNNKWST